VLRTAHFPQKLAMALQETFMAADGVTWGKYMDEADGGLFYVRAE